MVPAEELLCRLSIPHISFQEQGGPSPLPDETRAVALETLLNPELHNKATLRAEPVEYLEQQSILAVLRPHLALIGGEIAWAGTPSP